VSADELAAIRAVGSGTPLSFLPLSVREPGNLPKAVFVGWLTAFVPSVLLAMLGSLLAPQAEQPQFDVSGLAAIFGLVVFAPLVETLIMGTILLVLLLILPAWAAIVLSAAGWGVAHSLIAPIWGLVIWWPFLIFSTLFVAWRSRSLWLAFLVPACVHALQNLLPALLVATGAPA
jgi:membrane protease YdiL (CAAX protease family)